MVRVRSQNLKKKSMGNNNSGLLYFFQTKKSLPTISILASVKWVTDFALFLSKRKYTLINTRSFVCVYRKYKKEKNYTRGMFRDLRHSFRPSSSWIETLLRRSSTNIHFHFGKTQSSSLNIDSGKFYYYFFYFLLLCFIFFISFNF